MCACHGIAIRGLLEKLFLDKFYPNFPIILELFVDGCSKYISLLSCFYNIFQPGETAIRSSCSSCVCFGGRFVCIDSCDHWSSHYIEKVLGSNYRNNMNSDKETMMKLFSSIDVHRYRKFVLNIVQALLSVWGILF